MLFSCSCLLIRIHQFPPGVNDEHRVFLVLDGQTVAVVVQIEPVHVFHWSALRAAPVLRTVILHEVSVGVEEDAPVIVDTSDPDR